MKQHTRKDGTVCYSAVYYGPDGRRKVEKVIVLKPDATKTDHKRAAEKASARATERRVDVENRTWKPLTGDGDGRRPLTFRKLADRFVKEHRTRSGRPDYWQWAADRISGVFGERPAVSVTVADVERLRAVLEGEGLSPTTVRKALTACSTIFRWGKVRELVTSNPADPDLVKRPREAACRTEWLDEGQEAALLAQCPPWLSRIVRWAIYSGMDRGDVLALTWRDVDERAGKVFAPRGKTGAERNVRLNPRLLEVLAECRKARKVLGDPGGPVFLGREGEAPTGNAVNLSLKRAYRRAGIDSAAPFKRLRHTFGTRLAMHGGSELAIAQLLGHTSTAMARRYVHLTDSHLQGLVEKIAGAPADQHPGSHHEGDAADVVSQAT
jgi:integrase